MEITAYKEVNTIHTTLPLETKNYSRNFNKVFLYTLMIMT
jgi:hypothetical protein